MTQRIDNAFRAARKAGRKVLIPYVMAGDPDLATTLALIPALQRAGADIIELGIPFSDPIADGPVILRAAMRALAHDTSLDDVLKLAARVRAACDVPMVFMSYYNPIHHYGVERFVRDAVAAGVDGVIVPDLPPEEGHELIVAARAAGLATIFLLAPTSDETRIRKVSRQATGFVYYVSLTGITGAGHANAQDVATHLTAIRAHTNKPIAVGFGISTPEQARQMGQFADGVIVGSALVKEIETGVEKGRQGDALVRTATDFVARLRQGLDGGGPGH
ncbi:MAG: tryptophan synthase subunit alpha [Nitrospirota bacterium]|nr:tryptophan synthase subunit alpha [Nitrospirota bacterium]